MFYFQTECGEMEQNTHPYLLRGDTPTQIPKDLQFKFEPKLTTNYSSLSNLNFYYPLKWSIDKGT